MPATGYPTAAATQTAVTQAAAAEPGLGAPAADDSFLISSIAKVRAWVSAATARVKLGLGSAATKDTGTAAGQIPLLVTGGKLPAVDGSLLTNLPGGASTPRIAYVATNGHDTGASAGVIGDPSKPFATAQAAYATAVTAGGGNYVLSLGVGSFGGIALGESQFPFAMIRGVGVAISHLGGIHKDAANNYGISGENAPSLIFDGFAVDLGAISLNGGDGIAIDSVDEDGNNNGYGGYGGDGGNLTMTLDAASTYSFTSKGGNCLSAASGPDWFAVGGFAGTLTVTGGIGSMNFRGDGNGGTINADGATIIDIAHVGGNTWDTLLFATRSRWIGQNIVVGPGGTLIYQAVVYDYGGNSTQ